MLSDHEDKGSTIEVDCGSLSSSPLSSVPSTLEDPFRSPTPEVIEAPQTLGTTQMIEINCNCADHPYGPRRPRNRPLPLICCNSCFIYHYQYAHYFDRKDPPDAHLYFWICPSCIRCTSMCHNSFEYSIPEGEKYMVQCNGCCKWQHRECVGISSHASEDYLAQYQCEWCQPGWKVPKGGGGHIDDQKGKRMQDKRDYNQKYHSAVTLTQAQRDARRKEFEEWYTSNLG